MVMRLALAALPANLARVLDTGWGNSYSREKECKRCERHTLKCQI